MIGTILGNRYRLDELIGEGGMALVYKAECSLLQRPVAVKILRPQFASDIEFVERFRREAQSAARLSHPNVVNVYDVGQDHGLNYIVMEYVRGENLKELIRREAPFPVMRSLNIAKQISEALHHAHLNNVIHRDIKPHNILITTDGRLKVTDFGIARAISASTLTQDGSVLGSVQYFSPEQAKGAPAGVASDLYSLGCVIYEMLTGTVPFMGESPISIALKHLQEQAVPLREIRPDIPLAVERLVERALSKEPALRFPSALAMLREIQAIMGLSDLNNERELDLPTQVMQAAVPISQPKRGKPESRNMLLILLAVFGITVLVSGALIWWVFYGSVPSEVRTPTFKGLSYDEALRLAEDSGLRLERTERWHDEVRKGYIIDQETAPGMRVRKNSQIKVWLSKGPETVKVPPLQGMSPEQATSELYRVGLVYEELLERITSTEIVAGMVADQDPQPDADVPLGSTVTVSLSMGDQYLLTESFVGKTLEYAVARLNELGLNYNPNQEASTEYEAGLIVRQTPPPQEAVPVGTLVQLYVSSGPPINNP